jgi:hypothetical protein
MYSQNVEYNSQLELSVPYFWQRFIASLRGSEIYFVRKFNHHRSALIKTTAYFRDVPVLILSQETAVLMERFCNFPKPFFESMEKELLAYSVFLYSLYGLSLMENRPLWRSGGIHAIGPKVCGFKPCRGRWILRNIKIRCTYPFVREVKPSVLCRKILRHVKKPFEYERNNSQTNFIGHSLAKFLLFHYKTSLQWSLESSDGRIGSN